MRYVLQSVADCYYEMCEVSQSVTGCYYKVRRNNWNMKLLKKTNIQHDQISVML